MIESDDGFAGYDYEELVERWGLQDNNTTVALIARHIISNCDYNENGDCILDQTVKSDMLEFISRLRGNEWANDSLKQMCIALEILAGYDDHHGFVRWFCHCLPMLWV